MKNKNFISVGKILNFHGVRGEAKFGYSKNREEFLSKLKFVYICVDDEYKQFEIANIKFTPKSAIIKFKGIDSLNEIIKYKGAIVFAEEASVRENLEDDEFLIDELVGLNVYDGGERVGSVVGVSNNGASDLLSVKTNSKNVCLVPFVKAIVLSVDIKKKRIQINNIEGLLS
ncbi:MAG: 16S rRNA processing protein RimM [Cyanobacteria bacterium SIG31]|nr:16S rRNA processing protein RimM [Cyanobacteria bacterium SIG31]